MNKILLNVKVARAIGRALRSQVAETTAMGLLHRALADILLAAAD